MAEIQSIKKRGKPGRNWGFGIFVCVHAKSCLTLCDPLDHSLPGSSLSMGFSRQEYWRVAMPSSRGSSQPRDQTLVSCVSCIAGRFFTAGPRGKPLGIFSPSNNQDLCHVPHYPQKHDHHHTPDEHYRHHFP